MKFEVVDLVVNRLPLDAMAGQTGCGDLLCCTNDTDCNQCSADTGCGACTGITCNEQNGSEKPICLDTNCPHGTCDNNSCLETDCGETNCGDTNCGDTNNCGDSGCGDSGCGDTAAAMGQRSGRDSVANELRELRAALRTTSLLS